VCYYITAAVSGVDVEGLNAVWRHAGLQVEFTELNSPMKAQCAPGEKYLFHEPGVSGCDCGTWLGSAARPVCGEPHEDKEAAKMRKKGWSQAKIDRWAQEKHQANDRAKIRAARARDDDVPWAQVVRAALDDGRAARFGLILHWYEAAIETAQFTLKRQDLSVVDLNAELLESMEEDTLYSFTRGSGSRSFSEVPLT